MRTIHVAKPATAVAYACVAAAIMFAAVSAQAQWIDGGAPVSTAPETQDDPVIVSDGAGGAIIAWSHMTTSRDIYAQRISGDGVVLWTVNGVAVSAADGVQRRIAMVSDGAGGAIIAWEDYRAGSSDIYAHRIDAVGNLLWATDGVPVCTVDDNQLYPSIVSDGEGGAVIVWSDFRNGEDADIYTQRIDDDGNALWPAAGVPVATLQYYEEMDPFAVSDGAGGAMIAWYHFPEYGPFVVYCARIDANGNVLWTKSLMGLSSQFEHAIAYCPGGAIITWNEAREFSSNIYAQKVDTSGVKQWDAVDILVCDAPGSQVSSRVIPDGSGGAIVAWHDQRNGEYDIYARRIDTDGDTLWAPFGTPVCTASGAQERVRLAGDGAGGAIITWQDGRGTDTDIYAQSVDVNGNIRWASDGIPVCTETEDQRVPCIIEKGTGGAIIAWEDHRPVTFPDIYAQQVEWDGTTETELVSWSASFDGNAVLLGWKLSILDGDVLITLFRSASCENRFYEIENVIIVRDGLDFSAMDRQCEPGYTYVYRATVSGPSGERILFETDHISIPPMPVTLFQNVPNPFNPSTTIHYYLPERADVMVGVYDVAGRLVEVLEKGEMPRGYHEAVWSAGGVGSGVYFCRLTSGKVSIARKMVLLR